MEKYEIKRLTQEEYSLWDNFVDKEKNGHVFNKSAWTNAFSKIFNDINNEIVGCFANGVLVGGVNFCYKVKYGFPVMMLPPSTPYNNMVIQSKDTKYESKNIKFYTDISEILLKYLESKLKHVYFFLPTDIKDIRPYTWRGYQEQVRYTYQTSLLDLDFINKKIEHSIRKRLRRGQGLDYKLTIGNTEKDIKTLLFLENKSFERQHHKKSISDKNYLKFLNAIRNQIEYYVYNIYFEDMPVASRIEVIDGNICFDWRAGADPTYFDKGLNQVIIWDIMKNMKERGVELFDFGGANTSSIAEYKSRFNFNLKPLYRVNKFTSSMVKKLYKLK